MKLKGLQVTILSQADRSDPTNQLVVATARAQVDGVDCAWKGAAIQVQRTQEETLSLAVGHLIKQMLTKPKNAVVVGVVPTPPDVEFEVPDVLVAEYELGVA